MKKSEIVERKLRVPDTLTEENSQGKVWYDKILNNHVEFFTHYGNAS